MRPRQVSSRRASGLCFELLLLVSLVRLLALGGQQLNIQALALRLHLGLDVDVCLLGRAVLALSSCFEFDPPMISLHATRPAR